MCESTRPQTHVSILKPNTHGQVLLAVSFVNVVSQAGNKRTMARRAIELGLEPAADQVLTTPLAFNPTVLIQKGEKGKETNADIETGSTRFVCVFCTILVFFVTVTAF